MAASPLNPDSPLVPGLPDQIRLQLIDRISEMVWSLSPDGLRIGYMNEAARSVFGSELAGVLQRDGLWWGAIHPADKPGMKKGLETIRENGGFRFPFRVLRSDGSERQLEGNFLHFPAGATGGEQIVVLAHDSSERVQAQRHLTEAQAVYDSLVESLPIKVFRKNRHGRFVFCNQTFCEAVGLSQDAILGKTDADLFPGPLASKYQDDDRQILESGMPYHGVEEHALADGSVSWVEVIKSPVRDRDGRRVGIQGVFWDVTHRMLGERELKRAREIAEAASKSRGDFLANVSHEIRTPMNGILGLTELLLEQVRDRTQREYLGLIRQSAEGLMTLINDILDFSKMESGKFQLDINRFDPLECITESVRTLAVRAHAKQLELVIDADPDLPPALIGDAARLRQILTNLVGNAIKFTASGHVLVRATGLVPATEPGQVALLLEVEDTGIGIPQDKADLIFREFEQADSSTTREYGGTGLGLPIANQLAKLMSSEIRVDSQPGAGSRFFFRLDLPAVTHVGPPDDLPDLLAGYRVLLIEDHPASRAATARILAHWKMQVEQAAAGTEALALCRRLRQEHRPIDLILIDDSLPDVSTDDFVRELRAITGPDIHPAIAVMTSFQSASSNRIDLSLDRIHKPLDARELGQLLRSILGLNHPTTHASTAGPRRPPGASVRILLAEDNPVNQKVAVAMLERMGCAVQVAENGEEAVRLATEKEFDLILMDVQMPVMDGLEATRTIRERGLASPTCRIVGLSAHAGVEQRAACLTAGMDDYLSKPVRSQELKTVIEAVAGAMRQSDGAGNTPAGGPPVIDWGRAMETVGGDRRLLGEIIEVFLDDCPRQVLALDAAIAAGDAATLRRLTHSLRGSLSYLGAEAASATIAELEQIAMSGQLEGGENLQKRLVSQIGQLTSELHAFKTSSRGNPLANSGNAEHR